MAGGPAADQPAQPPWHLWFDPAKFHAYVDHVHGLGIEVMPGCHGPAIHGNMVDDAFELIRRIPGRRLARARPV
jgi:hypothetical protein